MSSPVRAPEAPFGADPGLVRYGFDRFVELRGGSYFGQLSTFLLTGTMMRRRRLAGLESKGLYEAAHIWKRGYPQQLERGIIIWGTAIAPW